MDEKVKDIPNQIKEPDLTLLKKKLDQYLQFMASDEYYEDNDWEIIIYESAIETFYGRNIWDWINSYR